MKPDFINDIDINDLVNEPEIPEPHHRFCMIFLIKNLNDDEDPIVNQTRLILEKIPWMAHVSINKNLIFAYFDNEPNYRHSTVNTAITLICKEKPLTIFIAECNQNQMDVFCEIRFYEKDCKNDILSYKTMKLYAAFQKCITKYPSLYIKNISSQINIEDKPVIFKHLNNWALKMDFYFASTNFIAFNYPILLKSQKEMPLLEDLWKLERKGNEKYLPREGTKVLGYYSRVGEYGIDGPLIVLCPEAIENVAKKGDWQQDSLFIYRIVLIHELSHALMDSFILYDFEDEKGDVKENPTSINWPTSRNAIAMEESLANMIVLQMMEKEKEDFQKAVKFIESQPLFYKFGKYQFEAEVNWKKWKESSKEHTTKLEEWFNYCF